MKCTTVALLVLLGCAMCAAKLSTNGTEVLDRLLPLRERLPEKLWGNRYVIALPIRNMKWLDAELMAISDPNSPRYGEKMDEAVVKQMTAAPVEQREAVIEWLQLRGFSYIVDVGDAIHFVADSLAHATQHLLREGKVFADDERRQMHTGLEALGALFVEGPGMAVPKSLEKLKEMRRGRKQRASPPSRPGAPYFAGAVGRQTLEYLYNIQDNLVSPARAPASSVSSCEYLNDQGFSATGLGWAQKENGFPANPIPPENIVGPNQGVNDESQLDVQIMAAVFGNGAQWFWNTQGWLFTLASEVYNYQNPPNVLSNSWGWAADQQCEWVNCGAGGDVGFVQRVNAEYAKLGGKRITIVCASGDAGAPGRTNEGCSTQRGVVAMFPASSPYVTAVGGTYVSEQFGEVNINQVTTPTPLCTNMASYPSGCANGTREGVTNFDDSFLPIPWTSGGGFSFDFEVGTGGTPTWQKTFVQQYLATSGPWPARFNRTGRAYPDVAANSNVCAVFDDNGNLDPEAGTSCACPIVAAIFGLINLQQSQAGKPLIGFANPALYDMAAKQPNSFNKILPGNNACTEYQCCATSPSVLGYYTANTPFDAVQGLGTPNVGNWRTYWKNMAPNKAQ